MNWWFLFGIFIGAFFMACLVFVASRTKGWTDEDWRRLWWR